MKNPGTSIFQTVPADIFPDGTKGDFLVSSQIEIIRDTIIKPHSLTWASLQSTAFQDDSLKLHGSGVFITLEAAIVSDLNADIEGRVLSDNIAYLCDKLIQNLQLKIPFDWNVCEKSKNESTLILKYHLCLRIARVLLYNLHEKRWNLGTEDLIKLVAACSYHADPYLPWVSKANSLMVIGFFKEEYGNRLIEKNFDGYMEALKPDMLGWLNKGKTTNALHNPHLSASGYSLAIMRKNKANNGLKPKLGFSGASMDNFTEDTRNDWKSSNKVRSISMIWFLMHTTLELEHFKSHILLITSFVLNLLDDYEPQFKKHGCILLNDLITLTELTSFKNNFLVKTGLLDVFLKSLKTCLTYLPSLTPVKLSYSLLSFAYPTTIKLLNLKSEMEGEKLCFVELVNNNILSSLRFLQGNESVEECNLVLLLMRQLRVVVSQHLQLDVLLCWSRVQFCLNQFLVNPFIIELGSEANHCIIVALELLNTLLNLFEEKSDKEGLRILLNYKYDFLAAYSILFQRIEPYDINREAIKLCRIGYAQLKKLIENCGPQETVELREDVSLAKSSNESLKNLFT